MDILGQSSLLVGVTSFALGFSTLARNVKNKLFIAFAVLTTLISGWATAFFLEKVWPGGTFYRWHLFFNIWLAPGSLAFIRVMVRIHDKASRRLLDLSVLAALGLTGALALRMESTPWILEVVYFAPAAVVLQILQLMWIDRRLRRGIKRHPKLPTVGLARRNLIYLGGLSVLALSVMDHVPQLASGALRAVPAFGNITLTIYLFFISQAISQQRLLNLGALFSRFLVLIAVALTLSGLYSLLVAWIQNSPGLFFLNSFIASFLILMLLDPLQKMVRYFTQRLLTQKHQRLEQTLREAQRRLAGIVDLGSLFQAVLLTAEQVLQPEWAALFILRGDGTRYRRVRSTGTEPGPVAPGDAPALREILADHPLLRHCQEQHRRGELPVLLDQVIENEIDRSASRLQREHLAALVQGLRALGANLLIPLIDPESRPEPRADASPERGSARILGFAALRVGAPPEPWGNNWGLLSILYPYFEQAAQTMRNMEVFVRSREKERLAALGEMAAGLAHEIRNPLGAIKGAAQFLDPSADRPESRFLKVIIEEVDRLNRVVTQFLDYSKPHAAVLTTVDVGALVKRTVEVLRPSIPAGIRLELAAPGPSGARVQGAPEQLQQVLINLIQNSVKALETLHDGRERSIRVGIETEALGRGSEVLVHVEDNGPGIRRENLDKLFIPFFTTSPSGTGLGLSISQKIIEAHRGRIDVATEEGRFSRFTVVLPGEQPQ